MSKFERLLLAVILLEIPLQIDTYFGALPESVPSYGAITGINVSITTFFLIGLYFLWLIKAALQSERTTYRFLVSVPLTIYVGVAGMSLFVAADRFFAISYLVLFVQAFLLFLYLANRLESRSDIVFMMTMLSVSFALQCLAVIACWLRAPQLMGNPISIATIHFAVTDYGRPCGTLETPVAAGSYLALLLVPVGSLVLTPVSRPLKLVALFALLVGVLAIPLTQSRGAILAAGIAAIIVTCFTFARGWFPKRVLIMGVLIALVAAAPLYRTYQYRIAEGDRGSAASRIHLSKIAWELIMDHPLVGVGTNNYYSAAEPYANSAAYRSEWAYTVHCDYLLIWAETGILGICAYVAFFLSMIHRGWKVWRVRDPLYSTLALAFSAAILGLMAHMFVDLFNSRSHLQTLMCCAAMLVAMERLSASVNVSAVAPIRYGIRGLKQATA